MAQPCPPLLQLDDGQAATVLRVIVANARLYDECAAKVDGLVAAWPK